MPDDIINQTQSSPPQSNVFEFPLELVVCNQKLNEPVSKVPRPGAEMYDLMKAIENLSDETAHTRFMGLWRYEINRLRRLQ